MNLSLILILLMSLVLAVLIVLIIHNKYNKDDEFEERPLVINSMPKYTKYRRSFGRLNRIIEQGNRMAVEFFPRDVNPKKTKEIIKEVIFVHKNNVKHYAKGDWSKDCEVVVIYPLNVEDMPESVRESPIGKGFGLGCSKSQIDRDETDFNNIKYESAMKLNKESANLKKILDDAMEERTEIIEKTNPKEKQKKDE